MENEIRLDAELLGAQENKVMADLRWRALAFVLDYTLLIAAIYYTHKLADLIFLDNISLAVLYFTIGLYSFLFVIMEYKFNGSIFKKLLKLQNLNIDGEKLGFHFFVLKLFLRPIAFLIAAVYLKFCLSIILWIFGIHKPLFRFFKGEIYVLWYDQMINQMTVKVDEPVL